MFISLTNSFYPLSRTMCPNCPLWSLIKTQEELVNAQRKFLEESVRQLIKNLKSWEEECSQVLKTKLDLQKALMDMNKVKDKQRQGKDNESAKSLLAFTESAFNNHRVRQSLLFLLLLLLYRFCQLCPHYSCQNKNHFYVVIFDCLINHL